MTFEIAPMIHFQKVPRCYRTQPGWRLATYKEARDNLDTIKEQQLLKGWERARLLNGWISGPCHNFEMGEGYRGLMGYMLVVRSHISGDSEKDLYADISLDRAGKEMALLLCTQDWNNEVVYWVLNSLAETDAAKMDPSNVRGGKIPFPETLFLVLNKMVNDFAGTLGSCHASEEGVNEKFSPRSIKKVLLIRWSYCWNKLDESYKKRLGRLWEDRIASNADDISGGLAKLEWLPNFASQGDVSDAMKNFTWDYLSSMIISKCVRRSLDLLIREWSNLKSQSLTTAQKNFLVSTRILFYLSYDGGTFGFETVKNILNEAKGKHVGDDVEHFKRNLRDASYWHVYNTENYGALEKVLHASAEGRDFIMMNKMLDYGAQPLCKLETETVLYRALNGFWKGSEDEVNAFVKRLFDKCNAKEQLANAVSENYARTALHWASWEGLAPTCELLLHYGGKPDAEDKSGEIPLHFAVENKKDEVIDVLVRRGKNDEALTEDASDINQNRIDMVNFKNRKGKSPLDIAVQQNNMKVVAKLLAISEQQIEYYFDKVDKGKLLRQFAFEGNTDIVRKLLKSKAKPDDVDVEGKTTLHYIAISENYYQAVEIYKEIVDEIPYRERVNLIAMCDLKGRTALHLAAEKGNDHLCSYLSLSKIRSIKDQDGQTPIYYAVKGNHDKAVVIDCLHWERNEDNLVNSTGLTPLHVAAAAGKIYLADKILSSVEYPKSYVKKPDFLGQTALHKACKEVHIDTIKVLLHWGAEPLLERDCDGRTALHYAVQNQNEEKGMKVVQMLLKRFKSEEKKLLFLWASAAGLGTADENLKEDSPLKNLLQKEKEDANRNLTNAGKETNLIRIAASTGDIEMTQELLTRGGQIADIEGQEWREGLQEETKDNVEKVLKQIQSIAEQGNDQPTMDDNLGRSDFACGLAALLLNPYLKPPINVGISGGWGKGKSSLMKQTEIILLKTRAQLALLPSSHFPGAQKLELSKKEKSRRQEIQRNIELLKYHIKFKGVSFASRMRKIFQENSHVTEFIQRWKGTKERINAKTKDEDSLFLFLNEYEDKYHYIFKSLAAMDERYLFTKPRDSPMEESVPAILTVQYNAWKYRNDKEALAGMAVEITREMERRMTLAQWISTSWRNTWEKQKQDIWMKVIFPITLAVVLAGTFTCIVWLLLDRYKFKRSTELKYASLPVTILITVWTLVKSVMNTVNPVSTQLINYIKFPNHAENLGYQEKVISDIKFLKEEVGRKPFLLCTIAAYILDLVNAFCTLSFLCLESFGEAKVSTSVFNASPNPRIIVFVDDLDRCHESVILQVLSAINLVLAVCEISVIVGMDKALIDRAIIKKYGDKNLKEGEELADQYLQKIIQLPLDLPDPDEDQSKEFLERQLGVFEKQRRDTDQNEKSKVDACEDDKEDEDYNALFAEFDSEPCSLGELNARMQEMFSRHTSTPGINISEGSNRLDETNATENKDVVIPMDAQGEKGAAGKDRSINTEGGDQRSSKTIPIKEMLFIRYSEGERDAFSYFQPLATGYRKFPREWKRLLNYHRLVWNIFSMSDEAKQLAGWQVQLITWIFICWEWQENMNLLIEKWNSIDIFKTVWSYRQPPSLKVIVADVIQNKKWLPKENMSIKSNKEGAIKLSEIGKKVVKKELKDKFKEVELESKDQGTKRKQKDQKSEKNVETKQRKEENWNRLKSTLDRYNVSMKGIQAFQRFRFYCNARHLQWPLPKVDS